ncbi:MAG: 30S ribosomal protein S18 [Acidimicrobiia bacterium]|nr:30S ribosomal protein S18 [Acidimicrobiia bacterium]
MAKSQGTPRKRRTDADKGRRMTKKPCYFCKEKVQYVDYKDVALIKKYVSDRAKIRAQRVSGNCPRHQRAVAQAVKVAREMALIPYVTNTEGKIGGRR